MEWLSRTKQNFCSRAFLTRTVASPAPKGPTLKKCLNYGDLVMLGVGAMVGAGVFVLTGQAARDVAGPAITASFLISSFVSVVTALCYAEFAVDYPLAGSAFNYISRTFGEFLAWIVAVELFAEYTLSSAAVAKGFSGYFASLIGLKSDALIWEYGFIIIDPVAFLLVLILSIILIIGIQESSAFNIVVTGINLAVVVLILGLAFPRVDTKNYVPFLPAEFGFPGLFEAASRLFFAYIGYDVLATVAEEVKNPHRDIPLGMIGSLVVTSILYVAMGAAITGMVSYKDIDVRAPFAVVFRDVGLKWVGQVVSLGAVTGTMTAVLAMLVGQTRIHMVLARERLLPNCLAVLHPRFKTPVNATVFTLITSAVPALFLSIDALSSMVSMGTLVTMGFVCAGILFRSYYSREGDKSVWPVAIRLIVLCVASICEGRFSATKCSIVATAIALGVWLVTTLSFYGLPVVYRSPNFNVPLKPITSSVGILTSIHLVCALHWSAFIRCGVWQCLGLLFYFVYCLQQDRTSGNEPEETQVLLEADIAAASET